MGNFIYMNERVILFVVARPERQCLDSVSVLVIGRGRRALRIFSRCQAKSVEESS